MAPPFDLPIPEMVISCQSEDGDYLAPFVEVEEFKYPAEKFPREFNWKKSLEGTWEKGEELKEGEKLKPGKFFSRDHYKEMLQGLMKNVTTASVECNAWMIGNARHAGGLDTGGIFELGITQFREANPTKEDDVNFLAFQGPCDVDTWTNLTNRDFVAKMIAWGHEPRSCLYDPDSPLKCPTGADSETSSEAFSGFFDLYEKGELLQGSPHSTSPGTCSDTCPCKCHCKHDSNGDQPQKNESQVSVRDSTKIADVPQPTLIYPASNRIWDKKLKGEGKYAKPVFGGVLLNPTVTHLLMCDNKLKESLRNFLEVIVPSVHVFVAGKSDFAPTFAAQKAMRGSTIIVMENTGIWANVLADAIRKRHKEQVATNEKAVEGQQPQGQNEASSGTGDDVLPQNTPIENFLVFDALKESAEEVVERLTLTLTTIMGDDLRALGFFRSEDKRLRKAWHMERQFTHNAEKFKREARGWHYGIVLLSVVTVVISVLTSLADMGPASTSALPKDLYIRPTLSQNQKLMLVYICAALPLLSTFMISGNSRFAPLPKYMELVGAAAKVRSTIYLYRARVGEFRSNKRNLGYMMKQISNGTVLNIAAPDPETQASKKAGGGCDNANAGGDSSAGSDSNKEHHEHASHKGLPSERFTQVLTSIHLQLMSGENRLSSLEEPGDNFDKEFKLVVEKAADKAHRNMKEMSERHRSRRERICEAFCKQPCWQHCLCCKRRHQIAKVSNSHAAQRHSKAVETLSRNDVESPCENDYRDNLCKLLSAEEYVRFRLLPTIAELKLSMPLLELQWRGTQVGMLVGTMMTAALGVMQMLELMPIVLALLSGLESISSFEQYNMRITMTNQALQTLERLHFWWTGLTLVEQRKDYNKAYLIRLTEQVANVEAAIYGQSMTHSEPPQAQNDGGDQSKGGKKGV
jgi:hypothetical protein